MVYTQEARSDAYNLGSGVQKEYQKKVELEKSKRFKKKKYSVGHTVLADMSKNTVG